MRWHPVIAAAVIAGLAVSAWTEREQAAAAEKDEWQALIDAILEAG